MICTVWHSCSYDFSVCNPFHPVLALHLFDAMVFNVLSMHTDQTHKGVRFIFIWGLSMGISSTIMLGVSCCFLLWAPISTEPLCPSSSLCFHPGWRVVCCVSTFLIYLFFMPPSSSTLFPMLGTNLSVWKCENFKKPKHISPGFSPLKGNIFLLADSPLSSENLTCSVCLQVAMQREVYSIKKIITTLCFDDVAWNRKIWYSLKKTWIIHGFKILPTDWIFPCLTLAWIFKKNFCQLLSSFSLITFEPAVQSLSICSPSLSII